VNLRLEPAAAIRSVEMGSKTFAPGQVPKPPAPRPPIAPPPVRPGEQK
jgi:hypothetical protein